MNANLLKSRIVSKGYSQKETAKRIGISPQSFSYKITGRREWSASEVKRLIIELDLDECDIMAIFFN